MKSVPWYAIILVCALAGILLEVILARDQLFPSSAPPFRLPPSPTKVDTILGLTSEGFFDATLWVQTVDVGGYLIYQNSWHSDYSLPESFMGDTCQPEVQELFEDSAGDIKSCQTIQPFGEWCAAPTTSFAVSKEGRVWKYEKELPCFFGYQIFFPLFCVGGLALGVVVLAFRWILNKVSKTQL